VSWFNFWLTLHILAAIVAFGPTFVFPVVGPMLATRAEHARFGYEIFHAMETRLIIPFALTMPISGIGLIRTTSIDVSNSRWLTSAILIYIVMIGLALFVQVPTTSRVLKLYAETAPGAAPPPQAQRLMMKERVLGMLLSVLFLAILVLMIWQPGAAFS
jgi:uncharacterized membrane protein